MSVRRNAPSIGIELQQNPPSPKPKQATRSKMPTALSPYLPTPVELRILLAYPVILVLGSLFSTLAPSVRSSKAQYSVTHQSYQPASEAPSYFAQKRNIFNVYFVKLGWFWTTFALVLFISTHPSFGRSLTLTAKRARVIARWALATGLWTLVTQWFFGPPLIDRSFRLTGGSCEILRAEKAGEIPELDLAEKIVTHAQCKVSGGTWSGGIDISGHVFLLILGSTLLWMEVLPIVLKSQGLREARAITLENGQVAPAESEAIAVAEREKAKSESTSIGVKVIVGIVGLMWWMLLMTAAFFHTWTEKLSGLIVAFIGVWLVYFLPRGVPVVRSLLGMPGI